MEELVIVSGVVCVEDCVLEIVSVGDKLIRADRVVDMVHVEEAENAFEHVPDDAVIVPERVGLGEELEENVCVPDEVIEVNVRVGVGLMECVSEWDELGVTTGVNGCVIEEECDAVGLPIGLFKVVTVVDVVGVIVGENVGEDEKLFVRVEVEETEAIT